MKHFDEVLNSIGFDISKEYSRFRYLVIHEEYGRYGGYQLHQVIDASFDEFPLAIRQGALSMRDLLSDYAGKMAVDIRHDDHCYQFDVLLNYCEFYYNLVRWVEENGHISESFDIVKIKRFLQHVEELLERTGYKIFSKDNGIIWFVPKSAEAELVSRIVQDSLMEDVLTYHHISFEGDLERKTDILHHFAKYFDVDSRRDLLRRENPRLEKCLYGALNNLNVRHNNGEAMDTSKYTEKFDVLSDKEKEQVYDDIYELCIQACLVLDSVDKTQRLEELYK